MRASNCIHRTFLATPGTTTASSHPLGIVGGAVKLGGDLQEEPRLPVYAVSARAWQGSDDAKGVCKTRPDETGGQHRKQATRQADGGIAHRCVRTGGEKGVVFADGVPRRRRMVSGLKQSFRERIR